MRSLVMTQCRRSWITSEIRAATKNRDATYKRALNSDCADWWDGYRSLRANVLLLLERSKNARYASEIKTALRLNNLWESLYRLGIVSSRLTSSPFTFFSHDGMNSHFASISNAAGSLPPSLPATASITTSTSNFS